MNLESNEGVCRICLKQQDTLFSLYRNTHCATSPYQKLVRNTNLKIELNDAGPSSICSQCLIDLDTTVSFLGKCEQSNEALAAMLELGLRKKCGAPSASKSTRPKFDTETWIDLEPVIRNESPATVTNPRSIEIENDGKSHTDPCNVSTKEHKCPECGSKRRCGHWSPPTAYSCHYCDKLFNKKYNFQIHLKRHRGERDWMCPVCGAAQLTASLAARHCRPRPRRLCPAPGCEKAFTTNSNLRIHMRSHSGERPFECDDCSKRFTSKKTLRDHIRIHTGEKPYMCPVCGARFTSNHLAAHMARHETQARARHACGRGGCARRFPTAAALRSHARSHAPARAFACALCSCAYKFKQSLNRHVRKRHGVSAHY